MNFEVAMARRQTAHNLRYKTQSFLDKVSEVFETDEKVGNLKANLKDYEDDIRQIESILAKPRPEEMLPLRVDENKVPIYPVEIKTDE